MISHYYRELDPVEQYYGEDENMIEDYFADPSFVDDWLPGYMQELKPILDMVVEADGTRLEVVWDSEGENYTENESRMAYALMNHGTPLNIVSRAGNEYLTGVYGAGWIALGIGSTLSSAPMALFMVKDDGEE